MVKSQCGDDYWRVGRETIAYILMDVFNSKCTDTVKDETLETSGCINIYFIVCACIRQHSILDWELGRLQSFLKELQK